MACSVIRSSLPIVGVFCAGFVHSDDYEHVLEVRSDRFGGERHRPWFLEDYRHDIVPYMSLP